MINILKLRRYSLFIGLLIVCFVNVSFARNVVINPDPNSDGRVDDKQGWGEGTYVGTAGTQVYVGDWETASDLSNALIKSVYIFQLPAPMPGDVFESATLRIYYLPRATTSIAPNYDCSLYRITDVNRPDILMSDYQADATLINASFITPADDVNMYYEQDVTVQVQDSFDNGQTTNYFIAFRLQEDGLVYPWGWDGDDLPERYTLSSVETQTAFKPELVLDMPGFNPCRPPYNKVDLDHDCYVTFKDMAVFLQSWMDCTLPTDPGCL
jgi:hypothetical protein